MSISKDHINQFTPNECKVLQMTKRRLSRKMIRDKEVIEPESNSIYFLVLLH